MYSLLKSQEDAKSSIVVWFFVNRASKLETGTLNAEPFLLCITWALESKPLPTILSTTFGITDREEDGREVERVLAAGG